LKQRRTLSADFSHLLYVTKECQLIYQKWLKERKPPCLTEKEIQEDILRIASARRRVQERIWAGKMLKKLIPPHRPPSAERVSNAMRRWGLCTSLTSDKKKLLPTKESYEIGKTYSENPERGRLLLYDRILRSECQSPFSPSVFLLQLRDHYADKVVALLIQKQPDAIIDLAKDTSINFAMQKVGEFKEYFVNLSIENTDVHESVTVSLDYQIVWATIPSSLVQQWKGTLKTGERAGSVRMIGPCKNETGDLKLHISTRTPCRLKVELERTFKSTTQLERPLISKAFDDELFVWDVVQTNHYSFDLARDWARYFDLANSRYLSKTEKQRLSRSNQLRLEYPKVLIYPTMRVSKVSECASAIQLIQSGTCTTIEEIAESLKCSWFASECIVNNLSACGIVFLSGPGKIMSKISKLPKHAEEIERLVVRKCLESPGNISVFSDWQAQPGQVSRLEDASEVPATNIFLFGKPLMDSERFFQALRKACLRATGNDPVGYAFLPTVRLYVCEDLRLSNNGFDSLLRELFHKRRVSLGGGAGDILRAISKKEIYIRSVDLAPFVCDGNLYTMVRVLD